MLPPPTRLNSTAILSNGSSRAKARSEPGLRPAPSADAAFVAYWSTRERGRPARAGPGTASAISSTRVDRQRRHGSASPGPMPFPPKGWTVASSQANSAVRDGSACGRDARAPGGASSLRCRHGMKRSRGAPPLLQRRHGSTSAGPMPFPPKGWTVASSQGI